MGKRNLIWFVVIVAVGAVVWLATSLVWGIVAAVAVLVLSEVVERSARKRRLAARGIDEVPSIRSAFSRRPRR